MRRNSKGGLPFVVWLVALLAQTEGRAQVIEGPGVTPAVGRCYQAHTAPRRCRTMRERRPQGEAILLCWISRLTAAEVV